MEDLTVLAEEIAVRTEVEGRLVWKIPDDFTVFCPSEGNPPYQSEDPRGVVVRVGETLTPLQSPRVIDCSCLRGQLRSITVRHKTKVTLPESFRVPDSPPGGSLYRASEDASKGLFTVMETCTLTGACSNLLVNAPRGGLVLVAGETGSLKSELTRALIFGYLQQPAIAKKRTPHLLTCEDPIEAFWPSGDAADIARSMTAGPICGINYTPRELSSDPGSDGLPKPGKDAGTVTQIIAAAKRQTPAAVFFGEIRRDSEIPDILDFAGTGHLVFATTHASSVTEAMRKLLRSMCPGRPFVAADRAELAGRVLAVIHNRPWPGTAGRLSAVIPSVWKSSAGTHSFVADGFAGLAPGPHGSTRYLDAVNDLAATPTARARNVEPPLELRLEARRWDLGL